MTMATLCILMVAMAIGRTHAGKAPMNFDNRMLFEGDRCTLPYNDAGVCAQLKHCETIVQQIHEGHRPQMCSYNKTEPVVCCPVSAYEELHVFSTSIHVKKPGDRAKEACEAYFQSSKTLSRNQGCSENHPIDIIYGWMVEYTDTPYMAAIGYGEDDISWYCGGSLISPKYVLTSGHCLQSRQWGPARWVRLGDLNLANKTDDTHAQQFSVSERIAHPDYRPPSHYNDVGLLRLDHEVVWNAYVHPACLNTNDVPYRLLTLGWGLTESATSKGNDDLMTVILHKKPDEECEKNLKLITGTKELQHGFDSLSMLCFGDPLDRKDTCKGDSGGPLQYGRLKDGRCMHHIAGVTSFGVQVCGDTNSTTVHSRVSHFVPWIENIVWP